MRTCSVCSLTKEESLFTKQGKYYRNICKSCTSERVRNYWKDNPDKYTLSKKVKRSRQHRRHGLTDEQYVEMIDRHGGLCHACKEEEAVCIDHDHACCSGAYGCSKCVRGLLCQNCNWALGNLKDRVDRAEKLIKYMAH